MLSNGKIYCDACNLLIDPRYHKHVRVERPETTGDDPNRFAHFHARDSGDCWYRTYKKAKALAEAKKPTQADMTAFEKFCAQQDAKRASAQKAG